MKNKNKKLEFASYKSTSQLVMSEILHSSINRWDPDYMGKLQGHMKTAFKFVMSVYKEYEDTLRSQGKLFVLDEMIEEVFTFKSLNN